MSSHGIIWKIFKAPRNLLKAQYEATVARQAAGMATQADVLSALKSVQDQDTPFCLRRSLLTMSTEAFA